jgi:cytoskeletal protein RodZ
MESPGQKLRTARIEKGLSIEQVSRDTNIISRYIEALEIENFSVFPGEPYIIGFLKNYSAYLDLDVQKILSHYRALRIQEQPIPVEHLLVHPPKFPSFIIPTVVALLLLCAAVYGIYYFIFVRERTSPGSNAVNRIPTEHTMEGNSMERRLYLNDSILFYMYNEIFRLELNNLGETVSFHTPSGPIILDLGQAASVDLNSNGIPELRITVADFSRNSPDMGALIHFYLMDSVALYDAALEAEHAFPALSAIIRATIIPASPSAYPFTLQTHFQNYCMFRWEILNERDRRGTNQNYFQRFDELSIQAQNGIRIWASNAQAARFQVIGGGRTFPVEIGAAGEVVVADIRWIRDEDNRYRLVLIQLESL